MNNDMEIDVEIQLTELRAWADRSLFYIAKMYTEQIGAGQDYNILKKCVSISILDFNLLEGEDFEMIAEKDQYIGSAYKKLQNISQDKQMQLEYEAREKAVRDYNQMMKEAREEGERIGREEMRETALKGSIGICRNLGLSQKEAITKIAEMFEVTKEEAETKVNQYWNG